MSIGTNQDSPKASPPRSKLAHIIGRINEIGPVWVASIASLIVAVTGIFGFLVGHASEKNGTAQPTATVIAQPTVTVTVTDPAPPTSPLSTGSQSGVPKDLPLGSYEINLTYGYSVPLSSTKPAQSQYDANGNSGDLVFYDMNPGDNSDFSNPAQSNDQIVALPAGSQITYQACTAGTTFTTSVTATAGAEFCVIETGMIAGLNVVALPSNSNSNYAVLDIKIWRKTS
jgi:hypothetical protein